MYGFDAGIVYKLRNGRLPWDVVIGDMDQHRRWFQTLLITSTILEDKILIKTIDNTSVYLECWF